MLKTKAKYYSLQDKKWQEIEVVIDKKLNFDYSHCSWFAIDGEFTGIYAQRDKDVLWTIASEDNQGNLRVEMLYTYQNDADLSVLKDLLLSDKEKLFWYGVLDLAFLMNRTGVRVSQPIFDVKIASRIVRTYTPEHNIDVLLTSLFSAPSDVTNKKELKLSKEFGIPPQEWSETLHQYNVNDVAYLRPISIKLKEMARYMNREEILNSMHRALPEIAYLNSQGFYRDVFNPFYNDTDMQSGILIPSKR